MIVWIDVEMNPQMLLSKENNTSWYMFKRDLPVTRKKVSWRETLEQRLRRWHKEGVFMHKRNAGDC